MPLVGTVDVERAMQAVETALRGASERQADHLIIDITGVTTVDATVAGMLVKAARGLCLLGTRARRRRRRGETIEAVGVDLPRDGAEVIDVSGARLMPGFIDGHTHMDMPFGGTVTADDWDTGTAAALAGGTTTLVDFSLQDVDGTLAGAVETWQGKAEQVAHRLRPARRDHQPDRGRQARAAVAARRSASRR